MYERGHLRRYHIVLHRKSHWSSISIKTTKSHIDSIAIAKHNPAIGVWVRRTCPDLGQECPNCVPFRRGKPQVDWDRERLTREWVFDLAHMGAQVAALQV